MGELHAICQVPAPVTYLIGESCKPGLGMQWYAEYLLHEAKLACNVKIDGEELTMEGLRRLKFDWRRGPACPWISWQENSSESNGD